MNNEVRDYNGAGSRVIGYRCCECQQVKPSMWDNICNECREKERRHQETLNAVKAESRATVSHREWERLKAERNEFAECLAVYAHFGHWPEGYWPHVATVLAKIETPPPSFWARFKSDAVCVALAPVSQETNGGEKHG